ncbi:2-C-methyl-D-erythritol 4-phosphate cytidylyltransferase [Psychromicrobium xiongbiense]|uniref:2-C-methyl-D-erythritol 4-phosphate cytidylyltransferase n=1 Tax=Psychromicrobium xiongbiense TaxID=3051184 RepID=UPI002554D6E8|nr:2-C-methyl-D-erythritol 4-phosphate cytidylyltransferase [Psychromicrobium sp. YIM S02556]
MNDTPSLRCAVVLVAAGSGQRLGRGMPKAQVRLGSDSILIHALRGIAAAGLTDQLCVVLPAGDQTLRTEAEEFAGERGIPLLLVDGGQTRNESVRNALEALAALPSDPAQGALGTVLVHDAARPLVPAEIFHRVLAALQGGALAVIPALAVVDTVKVAAPVLGHEMLTEQVAGTPQREVLRAVQTPQGFRMETLLNAHRAADRLEAEAVTDDAMLLEAAGVPVYLVRGSELSLKITTPLDLIVAEAFLEGPAAPRWVEG